MSRGLRRPFLVASTIFFFQSIIHLSEKETTDVSVNDENKSKKNEDTKNQRKKKMNAY